MILKTLIIIFIANTSFAGEAGVGRGGGGVSDEKFLKQRFREVIVRVETQNAHLKNREVMLTTDAIKRNLRLNPLKIKFVRELRDCKNNLPIKEKKDAWGCPGRLQLLSSFDMADDSMIFHELTRITPGYENIDEGMRLSVDILELDTKIQKYFFVREKLSKDIYTREDVEEEIRSRKSAGAVGFDLTEDSERFYLKTFWEVIETGLVKEPGVEIK